jgi:hypothetical protein
MLSRFTCTRRLLRASRARARAAIHTSGLQRALTPTVSPDWRSVMDSGLDLMHAASLWPIPATTPRPHLRPSFHCPNGMCWTSSLPSAQSSTAATFLMLSPGGLRLACTGTRASRKTWISTSRRGRHAQAQAGLTQVEPSHVTCVVCATLCVCC